MHFVVTPRKLLEFIISVREIEVDPKKVQAIVYMQPPKKISQIRSLQGRLQSIRMFISKLVDRDQPFNRNLHKGVKCIWNDECQ